MLVNLISKDHKTLEAIDVSEAALAELKTQGWRECTPLEIGLGSLWRIYGTDRILNTLGQMIPDSLKNPDKTLVDERELRNFRWAYSLLLVLAKRHLADANASLSEPNVWPAGQSWDELNGTSHSIFLRKAREEAGIPHDEFLEPVRSGDYDIDDLYEQAAHRKSA